MSRNPDNIEEKLESTRARLSENLGELGDRMSPGNIVDEALRYFETGPKEFAGTLGDQVRRNPMATVVTAAGLAWLAFGRDRKGYSPDYDADRSSGADVSLHHIDHDDDGYSDFRSGSFQSYARREREIYDRDDTFRHDVDTYRSDIETYDDIEYTRSATRRNQGENDSDYYRRLDDGYAERLNINRTDEEDDATYRARIRATVDAAGDRAREARNALSRSAQDARARLGMMGDRASMQARRAKRKAADFHDENPLVSGALALAVGAIAGSIFPVGKREHDALRPVADDLIERGADYAERAASQVEDHAQEVEKQAQEARRGGADDPLQSSVG